MFSEYPAIFDLIHTVSIVQEIGILLVHYDDFILALQNLGVRDALYCDMGSGWNYSWYRGENGQPVDIIGIPWPFSHNWLVFRK